MFFRQKKQSRKLKSFLDKKYKTEKGGIFKINNTLTMKYLETYIR